MCLNLGDLLIQYVKSPKDDEAIAGRSSSIKLGIEVFELSQVSVASF